jgi:cytochrome c biogenesis factor
LNKLSTSTAILLSFLLVALILGTELVIAGYQLINYSITRIAGPYYWFFQSIALAALMISILLNLFGSIRQKPGCQKCKATLVCFLPYAVSITLVILLMQAGIKINASLIVPLATTYLLLVLIYLEDKNTVFRILASVPFSKERKGYRLLAAEIEQFLGNATNGDKTSLKALTNALEKHIVSVAVDMSNGSQAKAAVLLGTSTSSVCRKINS